jgi:hypothetical protein
MPRARAPLHRLERRRRQAHVELCGLLLELEMDRFELGEVEVRQILVQEGFGFFVGGELSPDYS